MFNSSLGADGGFRRPSDAADFPIDQPETARSTSEVYYDSNGNPHYSNGNPHYSHGNPNYSYGAREYSPTYSSGYSGPYQHSAHDPYQRSQNSYDSTYSRSSTYGHSPSHAYSPRDAYAQDSNYQYPSNHGYRQGARHPYAHAGEVRRNKYQAHAALMPPSLESASSQPGFSHQKALQLSGETRSDIPCTECRIAGQACDGTYRRCERRQGRQLKTDPRCALCIYLHAEKCDGSRRGCQREKKHGAENDSPKRESVMCCVM